MAMISLCSSLASSISQRTPLATTMSILTNHAETDVAFTNLRPNNPSNVRIVFAIDSFAQGNIVHYETDVFELGEAS